MTLWSWREEITEKGSRYYCEAVARGEGHQAWVSAVAFDSPSSQQSLYRYSSSVALLIQLRFGSVGQDGRLLIWEYDKGAKERGGTSRRDSMGLYVKKEHVFCRNRSNENRDVSLKSPRLKVNRMSKINGKQEQQYSMVIVGASTREQVFHMKPISNHKAHQFPCSSIAFVRGLSKWYINSYNKDQDVPDTTTGDKKPEEDKEAKQQSTTDGNTKSTETEKKEQTADGETPTGNIDAEVTPKNELKELTEGNILPIFSKFTETPTSSTNAIALELKDDHDKRERRSLKPKVARRPETIGSIVTASWGGDIKYWEYEELEESSELK